MTVMVSLYVVETASTIYGNGWEPNSQVGKGRFRCITTSQLPSLAEWRSFTAPPIKVIERDVKLVAPDRDRPQAGSSCAVFLPLYPPSSYKYPE